jgi:AAA+ ATPase superfamily predicted ATPase
MQDVRNPFITSGYRGKEFFCDRDEETRKLLSSLENGQSVTLTALRRMGKTGLIRHVLSQLPKNYTGIYLDMLPTENLRDFLNALATSVYAAIPEQTKPGKMMIGFLKSLRPVISFDPLTGYPQFTIDVRSGEAEMHIQSVLRYLEEYPLTVVIAIDEFQQILNYPEKNTDAFLRTIIQSLNNIRFIFSGSQQHLMTQLFADPKRPFYQSAGFMKINKIDSNLYTSFIDHHFKQGGFEIGRDTIHSMLQWADHHTYYVQLLCNRVFASPVKQIDNGVWQDQAAALLQEQEAVFFKYRDLLSKHQWNLLKAMASESYVYSPTSKDFISKYNLGSPATVLRSLQALLLKEMIYSDHDSEGRFYYSVYDILFRRWMQGK